MSQKRSRPFKMDEKDRRIAYLEQMKMNLQYQMPQTLVGNKVMRTVISSKGLNISNETIKMDITITTNMTGMAATTWTMTKSMKIQKKRRLGQKTLDSRKI